MQGKIIRGIAGFYYVETEDGRIYECKARGIFRNQNIKPLTGDDVEIEPTDEEAGTGNMTKILPRRSELIRPPVANVDQALIIFAITYPDPNFNLLDRFLIMMRMQKLPVVICFNKQDIASAEMIEDLTRSYAECDCKVVFCSVAEGTGMEELRELLRGRTTVLAGPSGVGKSSLINALCPHAQMETGELSRKIARGRNTTRHSQVFCSEPGTYLMDTPGFTSLYLPDLTSDVLGRYYPEFDPYVDACRFRGCTHTVEPSCAVMSAVQDGAISGIRYDNYKLLFEELKAQESHYRKSKRGGL